MTNAELIQKIRNEIERRITDNTFGAKLELIDILAWLDTLESEKPMNQEGLEEEVKRYYSENFEYLSSDQPTLSILTNVARHFAQWQKEKMLKEAVEGEVATDNRGNNVVRAGVFNKDFEYGDKVRVIIVKE